MYNPKMNVSIESGMSDIVKVIKGLSKDSNFSHNKQLNQQCSNIISKLVELNLYDDNVMVLLVKTNLVKYYDNYQQILKELGIKYKIKVIKNVGEYDDIYYIYLVKNN